MEERTQLEVLLIHVKDFLKENFNLLVLNAYEKISRLISGITSVLFLVSLLGFVLLFISIGLSLWIGKLMDEAFLGFFIVGGVYLLMGILAFVNREKWIQTPMIDTLLRDLTDEEN